MINNFRLHNMCKDRRDEIKTKSPKCHIIKFFKLAKRIILMRKEADSALNLKYARILRGTTNDQ